LRIIIITSSAEGLIIRRLIWKLGIGRYRVGLSFFFIDIFVFNLWFWYYVFRIIIAEVLCFFLFGLVSVFGFIFCGCGWVEQQTQVIAFGTECIDDYYLLFYLYIFKKLFCIRNITKIACILRRGRQSVRERGAERERERIKRENT